MFNPLASFIFCGRNCYKTANGDYTRGGATTAQFAGLFKELSNVKNDLGDFAKKTIEKFDTIAKSDKAFNYASKAVKFASNNVNSIIGAAGIVKVATADDKKTEAFVQGGSFLGMILGEGWMKRNLKEGLSIIPVGNRWGKVLTGVTFVTGSIAASTTGEYLGHKIAKYFKDGKV